MTSVVREPILETPAVKGSLWLQNRLLVYFGQGPFFVGSRNGMGETKTKLIKREKKCEQFISVEIGLKKRTP